MNLLKLRFSSFRLNSVRFRSLKFGLGFSSLQSSAVGLRFVGEGFGRANRRRRSCEERTEGTRGKPRFCEELILDKSSLELGSGRFTLLQFVS